MNDVIRTLMNHRSYRQYADKPVPERVLDSVLRAVQAAPSWIHGQQVSVVVIRDEARKQEMARLSGNQAHVASAPVFLVFCADFQRAFAASEIEGGSFAAIEDVDVLLVGATDVGIGMGNAIAAAESLGLGIIPIGGIRRSMLEVARFLELPSYVIPIAGLCLGYPSEKPDQKPRLPIELVRHEETYSSDDLSSRLREYNAAYRSFLAAQGMPETDWTKRVADFYAGSHYNGGYPDVAKTLKQQGFIAKDMRET
ncbi:NADPH-dependent oxidoreductase [Xylanibacillus composti]|uniref:NADPH-dependent oxidoreductase n=1 Tax=Xylanibacillus composti TaxID=1572762 RepID=A0A8J4H4R0_9BACL|nr:nitroreductase family protein [Xylanibacillus composti]MDT9727129.1 NADPH-dependent oxidoreductase [Xylanibacillus composti]GIQ68859.1 NADPH-dependent oxidoreductase [Xylanibacillus composti]